MPIYKTNEKRDGLTKYRVVVNYTDQHGKYKSVERTAYGSAAAKALESQLRNEYKTSVSARMSVRDLFEEYLQNKKKRVRYTTLIKTEEIIEQNVIPYLGDTKLDKLTVPLLEQWENKILEKDIELRTRQNYYSHFRAMLNYAVRMNYIQKNPLVDVGNFIDTEFTPPRDKIQYYTKEQFTKYHAAMKATTKTYTDWAYYVFFCISYFLGTRKGETNELRWYDDDGDIIHIRRSVNLKMKGGPIVTAPKNKTSYRDIKKPLQLKQIMLEHKQRQLALRIYKDDNLICGGLDYLPDTTLSYRNKLYAKAAGLPEIRIHDFRHSHASLLCNEGINIQEVARRLGHSKIEETWNTYSHLYPREEDRALKVLEDIKL
jgi:integrase